MGRFYALTVVAAAPFQALINRVVGQIIFSVDRLCEKVKGWNSVKGKGLMEWGFKGKSPTLKGLQRPALEIASGDR